VLEGLGWALLGAAVRTGAKHIVGTSGGSADIAGLAVPIVSAVLSGHDVQTAVVGGSIGVAAAELGDRIVPSTARIVAWGDSHGEAQPRHEIIRRMAAESAVTAYVFMGDAEGWDRWFEETEVLRTNGKVFAVNGNHDDEPNPSIAGARLPAVLRMGSANVVLLPDPPRKADVNAMVRDLDTSLDHTLVFLHKSPIAFSVENRAGAALVLDALEPLLARGSHVFCGHHHVYGWGTIGPSSVVSAGIAGSKHYTCECRPPCLECDAEVRGYLRIDVGRKVAVSLVQVTVDHG
jgi:predicted phosphodiesterase